MAAPSHTLPHGQSVALHDPAARPSLAWLLAPIKAWLNRQAVRQELLSLDARSLQDIGITQGDFPAILSGRMQRPGR